MKKRSLFIAIVFVIGLAPLAWGNEHPNYFSAGAGFLFYNSDIDEKTELDFAFDGEISFGRYFNRNIATELVMGYIHDGHGGDNIAAYSLKLAALGIYPLGKKIRLFAGGGLGYYFSEYHGFINGVYTRDEDNRPGANIIAGAEFDVGCRFFGRFQCGYRFIKDLRFDRQTLDLSGFSVIMKIGVGF